MILLKKALMALSALTLLSACGDDNLNPSNINAPSTYDFSSRNDQGSGVDLSEARTRLILIQELDHLIGSEYLQSLAKHKLNELEGQANSIGLARDYIISVLNRVYEGGTTQTAGNLVNHNVYDLYDPKNIEEPGSSPIKGTPQLQDIETFSQLKEGINIKQALPGIRQPLHNRKTIVNAFESEREGGDFIGWINGAEPDGDKLAHTMIQDWFERIATLATDSDDSTRFIKNGVNYKSIINSFLINTIPYAEVSYQHLNPAKGLLADHQQTINNKYTALEQHWDSAFAYSGYPINAQSIDIRSLKDATFSAAGVSELYNYGIYNLASQAAYLDIISPLSDTNFTEEMIQALLEGRYLLTLNEDVITDKTNQTLIKERADKLLQTWEKIIAANCIKYLNKSIDSMLPYNESEYVTHWSRAKGSAIALEFNPNSIITKNDLTNDEQKGIHNLFGSKAEVSSQHNRTSYASKLKNIRYNLQQIYAFSENDKEAWGVLE